MSPLKITEAISVQFPMVEHAAEIGWKPISPQNAIAKRGGVAGMLFREELETTLHQFNTWMSADAVRQAIERLEALPPTIKGNLEMLTWLRGKRQCYDDTKMRQRYVQLVDFENPDANSLYVTWEWHLKPPARKSNRADVMFVVNGIPVAIVEHKNPKDHDAIERGIKQLCRYEIETPELLTAPQLFNVTHLVDYWYGTTWSASRRYMARWKEQPDESYRFAVQSFFEPAGLLRTLRDWILFHVEDGETRKSVLRQHQRRAANRILARCAEPEKRRGLIWHTQGSGKTFTLLTAARLILEGKHHFRKATVIVVVDRTELEGQLNGWVKRLLGEMQQQDIPIKRTGSRAELQDLLRADMRGLILSMIHKFKGIEKNIVTRDNVYVFIDEAHRSVARELGTYLMAAVPNATIIGFTGTPINRTAQGEGTFKIFGTDDEQGYLDKYSVAESIEDETTLPIHHTMAPSDMTVPSERLDKDFFALAEAEGVTDINELNKVLDRAIGLRTFLTADNRIEKVAAFVAKHFQENVEPMGYKAFLVGVNREACAKYKHALDKLLPREWTVPIYTENTADIIDRPLVAELQLSPEHETEARLMFRKGDKNPKLLIVTDKLLTGYDAPLLYCLYLDKPMRDHVLLQAIARVNRPHVDSDGNRKRIGLVVDFVGVLREMKKALRFDSEDINGVIEDLDLLIECFIGKVAVAKTVWLDAGGKGGSDERLEGLVYGHFLDSDTRTTFYEAYKEIEALWEILSPSPKLRDQAETFKQLAQLYATVRNAYTTNVDYVADLAHKTRRLVQKSTSQKGLGQLTKSVTFDLETLEALATEPGSDEAKVFSLVRGLRAEVESNAEMAPVLQPLKKRAERILQDLEDRKTTGLAAIDLLRALAMKKEEVESAVNVSGLSKRAFAVHLSLKDDTNLATARIATMNLAREAETLLARFPNAAVNSDERRQLRVKLYRPLLTLGKDERCRVVDQILVILLPETADGCF